MATVKFTVPDEVDIEESPPKGKFFTRDPLPNPTLDKLRAGPGRRLSLGAERGASLRPNTDRRAPASSGLGAGLSHHP